jgi:hypothetical protein
MTYQEVDALMKVARRLERMGMKRILMVGMAGLALVTLIACGLRKPLPEGAELIPADATFAISLDIPSLMKSRVYEMYKQREASFGLNRVNFLRFAEATGLDPSRDVQRLIFIATAGDEGLREMSGVAMGTFDGRKVLNFLKDSGLPSRQVAGMDIFEILVLDGRCRFCVGVVDASTAVFGDDQTLEKIARVRAGETPGLSAQDRAGRLLRRMGRDPEGWGILRAGDLRERLQDVLGGLDANGSALAALGPIQEVSFSFDNAEPVRILVELTATSEQDAMRVADILKGAESLGRLALKETRPELGGLMSDLRVEADTGIVRVAGSLPSSDIDIAARILGSGFGDLTGEPGGAEGGEADGAGEGAEGEGEAPPQPDAEGADEAPKDPE